MRRKRTRLLLPCALIGLAAALGTSVGAGVSTGTAAVTERETPQRFTQLDRGLVRQIITQRNSTWRWQDVMGRPHTPFTGAAVSRAASRDYRRWALGIWQRRAKQAWRAAQRPPHYQEWLCIHRYEGSWTDPNAPYYGGLQMDLSFQRAYGWRLLRVKGTADNWSPLEQMWVAEKAHASGRGFYPWPNTARYCGLL
jgi:hypothetical protein